MSVFRRKEPRFLKTFLPRVVPSLARNFFYVVFVCVRRSCRPLRSDCRIYASFSTAFRLHQATYAFASYCLCSSEHRGSVALLHRHDDRSPLSSRSAQRWSLAAYSRRSTVASGRVHRISGRRSCAGVRAVFEVWFRSRLCEPAFSVVVHTTGARQEYAARSRAQMMLQPLHVFGADRVDPPRPELR